MFRFTLDGIVYDGFAIANAERLASLSGHQHAVIVWFEGEPECWVVDDLFGYENLQTYYKTQWPTHPLTFTRLKLIESEDC